MFKFEPGKRWYEKAPKSEADILEISAGGLEPNHCQHESQTPEADDMVHMCIKCWEEYVIVKKGEIK